MAIEFEQRTKSKISVIWINETNNIKYNVGSISGPFSKFNEMRIEELEQILTKMKELQNGKNNTISS